MAQQQVEGVRVDDDAVAKHTPVTVVVTRGGMELDADTWSDANNYLASGGHIKEGYPTGPTREDFLPPEDEDEAAAAAPEQPRQQSQPRAVSVRPTPTPTSTSDAPASS